MAETAATPAPAASAEGAPSGGSKVVVGGMVFAGILLGGLVGSLVVAPRIIARRAAAVVAVDSVPAAAGAEAGSAVHGEGEGGAEKKLVVMPNIIVNPAGTQGSRFLMTTIAISVGNDEAQKVLSDRQVELRDRITSILETRTMTQLTSPGERDSLKLKIAAAAGAIVGPKVPLKVFLPQFVIQ